METKSKSDKLIFWGFVFLVISFFGLLWYFHYQNTLLDTKKAELKTKEEQLKIKEVELTSISKEKEQIQNLVPPKLQEKVDSISKQTNATIRENVTRIVAENGSENSVVYIQVGSDETRSSLMSQDFIAALKVRGYNVINTYDLEDPRNVDNTIRYFNAQDKILAENIGQDIQRDFPKIVLRARLVSRVKAPVGQIELWIR